MTNEHARHLDWSPYYEEAEAEVVWQWPLLERFMAESKPDLATVLDFACGRGRIAERFANIAGRLICTDISSKAIEYCRQRFAERKNVECHVNGVSSIPVPDASITFLYSWDSMVHFDQAELAIYFAEFKRALMPAAIGLVHHSNFGALSAEARPWRENPGWRAPVSQADVRTICDRLQLRVLSQTVFDWSQPSLDCVTVFQTADPAR